MTRDCAAIFLTRLLIESGRRTGRRTIPVAVFIVIVLVYCIHSLSLRFATPSSSPWRYAQPIGAQTSTVVSTSSRADPPPDPTPAPERPSCVVTKVSMLYGSHKYPQLEGAVDSHRRNSERWGCGFEELREDVTDRKLYSKHYFLLSTLLGELSQPPEQRQHWLM